MDDYMGAREKSVQSAYYKIRELLGNAERKMMNERR